MKDSDSLKCYAMICDEIHDIDECSHFSAEWDDLVSNSDFSTVFATSGFARAWWRAYGNGKNLRLIVLKDSDSVVRLVAPLYSHSSAPHVLRLIGDFRGDYNNVVFAKDDYSSVLQFFGWLRSRDDWRSFILHNVPGNSALLFCIPHVCGDGSKIPEKLRAWVDFRYPLVHRFWHQNHPRISRQRLEELVGTFVQDYRKVRSHVNWFSKRGVFSYQCVSDQAECLALLPDFMQLHIEEWASKNDRSLFLSQENRIFYEQLIKELAPSGAIRFDLLTLDGKMLAAHLGFNWRGSVAIYKWCYAVEFSKHSPGKVLLAHILNDALQRDAIEVDFLKGGEEFKASFASDVRRTGSLVIQRSRVAAVLARVTNSSEPR
jgi:CelD/BcsL family acetyltransferase involved in cellulose biosynthesis